LEIDSNIRGKAYIFKNKDIEMGEEIYVSKLAYKCNIYQFNEKNGPINFKKHANSKYLYLLDID